MTTNQDRLRDSLNAHLSMQGMCAIGPLRINGEKLWEFIQDNYTPNEEIRECINNSSGGGNWRRNFNNLLNPKGTIL